MRGRPAGRGGEGGGQHVVGCAGKDRVSWLIESMEEGSKERRRTNTDSVKTSGELGTGTGCGLEVRAVISLEASSSGNVVVLVVAWSMISFVLTIRFCLRASREGAVFSML